MSFPRPRDAWNDWRGRDVATQLLLCCGCIVYLHRCEEASQNLSAELCRAAEYLCTNKCNNQSSAKHCHQIHVSVASATSERDDYREADREDHAGASQVAGSSQEAGRKLCVVWLHFPTMACQHDLRHLCVCLRTVL